MQTFYLKLFTQQKSVYSNFQ